MAKNKEEKTNVMRTLDQKKIPPTATTRMAPSMACPWRRYWASRRSRCSKRW